MGQVKPVGSIGWFGLPARLPVAGFAAAVHDRDDENELRFDSVQHAEGEDVREAAVHVFVYEPPLCGRIANAFDCLLDRGDEAAPDLRIALRVVTSGFLLLRVCFRMELMPHRLMARRTLRRASAPEMVFTRPDRTSSRRRFASSSHKRSIRPISSPPRLSTNRSASSARDSAGSFIACSATRSMFVAIETRYAIGEEIASCHRQAERWRSAARPWPRRLHRRVMPCGRAV